MKLELYNNICKLVTSPSDAAAQSLLSNYVTGQEIVRTQTVVRGSNAYQNYRATGESTYKTVYQTNYVPLYVTERVGSKKSGCCAYVFPRGLYDMMPDHIKQMIEVEDHTTTDYSVDIDLKEDWALNL